FKLPFLSWIPESLRSPYVRAAKRGPAYDCLLPTRGGLLALVRDAGLEAEEQTIATMRAMLELERLRRAVRAVLAAPEPPLELLLPVNPTMIFLLRKAGHRAPTGSPST
ncbi:MAG: hypothetical protein ABI990_10955, partial [Actinomycetota bacterium]